MSLTFPTNPTNGQIYPEPALVGFPQFQWNSTTKTWVKLDTSGATETRAGIAEIATQAEVDVGNLNNCIVTPKTLKGYVDASDHFNTRVTNIVNDLGLGSILVVQSPTSHTISIGSKTFTYSSPDQADFFIGQRLRVAHNPNKWMIGSVTNITPTSVSLDIDNITGTGTYSDWTIGVSAGIDFYASEESAGLVQLASADVVREAMPTDLNTSPSVSQVVTAHKLAIQLANVPTIQITNGEAPTQREDQTDLRVGDLWWKTANPPGVTTANGLYIYLPAPGPVPEEGDPLYQWVSVTQV